MDSRGTSVEERPQPAKRIVVAAVSVAAMLSAFSLFGWLLGWRLPTSLAPQFATMKPNTAICLISAAWAVWLSRTPLLRSRHSTWIAILAVLIATISVFTLSEYLFHWNAGIDELLFRDSEHFGLAPPPGRIAPGTAMSLLMFAIAVFVIDRYPRLSHFLCLNAILIALVGLLGYLYQLPTVYSPGKFTSIALNTVLSLLAVGVGLLASRPDFGLTGLLTRSHLRSQTHVLIAGAICFPMLLGSIALWGERNGIYGGEFTFVFFSVLLIVLTVLLVWVTGRQQLAFEAQRTASEEALRDSEERFRAMADNIPNLAWMAHADGHIFWYNSQWHQYTGMPLSNVEGWGWQRVHDSRFVDEVVRRWRAALESGSSFEMEFPLLGGDGVFRWFLTRVSPVRNEAGDVIRWFGTNTNIDDKRKAEDALKESEELSRTVIEGSPEGVELLDEKGQTLLINRQGCGFRALRPNAAAIWMDSWGEQDYERASDAFAAALTGKPVNFIVGLNETSPEPVWLDISLTPLRESGIVKRVLGITRDITKARKAEEKLNQTAKLESLGVMAGGIAHDFNNLLTGILGYASLLTEAPDETVRELSGNILKASERAADLTRQMLAYSGKGRFEVRPTDLSVNVRELLPLIKPVLDKNVEVELNLAEGLSCVEADPGQMHQVVMNLIINGAEAIGGKHGRVTVTTAETDLDEAFIAGTFTTYEVTPGRYVCLTVQDTGSGMNEETKAKIFDPFFTTKFTGRGLGLAAVSGIVRGHKGALRLDSVPGEGTTFQVFLPALPSRRPDIVAESDSHRGKHSGEGTILLVDDEEIVRQTGRACLKRHGYGVILAENGREAVDLFNARSSEITLIILDMTMPIMGGKEALGLLTAARPGVPVIVCSGYSESDVIGQLAAGSVSGFLQKPYSCSSLTEALKLVLEKSRSKSF